MQIPSCSTAKGPLVRTASLLQGSLSTGSGDGDSAALPGSPVSLGPAQTPRVPDVLLTLAPVELCLALLVHAVILMVLKFLAYRCHSSEDTELID